MNKLIRTNQSKIRSCVGFSVYINASRPDCKARAGDFTHIGLPPHTTKYTNCVRKYANMFDANGALTPQKRRNVPIVEDFGPICKEFSA